MLLLLIFKKCPDIFQSRYRHEYPVLSTIIRIDHSHTTRIGIDQQLVNQGLTRIQLAIRRVGGTIAIGIGINEGIGEAVSQDNRAGMNDIAHTPAGIRGNTIIVFIQNIPPQKPQHFIVTFATGTHIEGIIANHIGGRYIWA